MGRLESTHRPSGLVSALVLFLLCCSFSVTWGQSQAGFLNIDCGASDDYEDPVTGIKWVPDAGYIPESAGQVYEKIAPPTDKTYADLTETKTLRAFSDLRAKNCYTFSVTKNLTYMLRTSFWYGNYDNAGKPPTFQVSVDATVVENITTSLSGLVYMEVLYIAQTNVSFMCLLRDGSKSTPFITAITLKPVSNLYTNLDYLFLGQKMYVKLLSRLDFGGTSLTRFPKDFYDRYWHPEGASSSYLRSTTTPVKALGTTTEVTSFIDYWPPSNVMQTAVTTAGVLKSYMLPQGSAVSTTSGYLALHFAELDESANITTRDFQVDIGDDHKVISVNPYNFSTPPAAFDTLMWSFWNCKIGPTSVLTMTPSPGSLNGPILNALELFAVTDIRYANTRDKDVFAIENIKKDMNLTEWTGDPCLPFPHAWVQCNTEGTVLTPPQVIAVNLSGYNLQGPISPNFAELVDLISLSLDHNALTGSLPELTPLIKLKTLRLNNNNLSGSLPDWLTSLPSLKTLTVQGNSFSGSIPPGLLSSNMSFESCPGNQFVSNNCAGSDSKGGGSSKLGAVIGATVGGLLFALLILGVGVFIGCRSYCRQISRQEGLSGAAVALKELGGTDGTAKRFTLAELTAATNNFKREIGRGGFGPVYHGTLSDGREVAVKVSDGTSPQGEQEFVNEVLLLSRVHHRNLVALLGFCIEKKKQILVYEYVRNGSLQDQLHGTASKPGQPLDWKMRLNIALNAAQGLDYLHSSCTPSIIHRDVKSGNILLSDPGRSVVAMISDFGLSRAGPQQDATHVLTAVKGTAGYLDPQYYGTQKLTLKSDVFSFGVVLLELLTGRIPIDPMLPNREDWNVCQYVRNTLGDGGDINQVLDPALRACRPNPEAVWRVAEISLRSVEPKPIHRPTMMEVVEELRAAIATENHSSSSPSPHFGGGTFNPSMMSSNTYFASDAVPSPRGGNL